MSSGDLCQAADVGKALVQGVYGYGMELGIIEPDLPAAPLDAHASPAVFPNQFPQTTPAALPTNRQLSARGVSCHDSRSTASGEALEIALSAKLLRLLQSSIQHAHGMAICFCTPVLSMHCPPEVQRLR